MARAVGLSDIHCIIVSTSDPQSFIRLTSARIAPLAAMCEPEVAGLEVPVPTDTSSSRSAPVVQLTP